MNVSLSILRLLRRRVEEKNRQSNSPNKLLRKETKLCKDIDATASATMLKF